MSNIADVSQIAASLAVHIPSQDEDANERISVQGECASFDRLHGCCIYSVIARPISTELATMIATDPATCLHRYRGYMDKHALAYFASLNDPMITFILARPAKTHASQSLARHSGATIRNR
jgi:hypothetical protein